MTVYYLIDKSKADSQSEKTGVYSALYLEEMVSRLGVPACELPMDEVVHTAFQADDVLLIGAEFLTNDVAQRISKAAEQGTLIFGFGTTGGESIFGCTVESTFVQQDLYETVGWFTAPHTILPTREENISLPVMAEVLVTKGGTVLASITGECETVPGLIAGKNTYYFPFDLPYVLLKIIQGKPVPYGPSSYFPVGRIPDGRSLPYGFDSTNAVADLYLLVLENILAKRNIPMVHTLPPMEDEVPSDLLLFFGGDDDNTSAQLDEAASQIMAQRGLPYHINLMPGSDRGDYTLTKEDFQRITARGHELALHYDMTGVPFTQESFQQQMDTYMKTYGVLPVSNVGHCLVNVGYSEYARFQSNLGVKGDAGRVGTLNPNDINAFDIYDFGFGTAFPHFVYDDVQHKSKRLPFCGIPMSYYEPRQGGAYGDNEEKFRKFAYNAAYYGQPNCLFSHPHYIASYQGYDSSMTLRAFDTVLDICSQKNWKVYLTTPDELCLWWHERDACTLQTEQGELKIVLAGNRSMVLKLPAKTKNVLVNGVPVAVVSKTIGGIPYRLVTLKGKGTHTVQY